MNWRINNLLLQHNFFSGANYLPQSYRVTEWQTPKGTQHTDGWNFFVPDFNKLFYLLRSQGDNSHKNLTWVCQRLKEKISFYFSCLIIWRRYIITQWCCTVSASNFFKSSVFLAQLSLHISFTCYLVSPHFLLILLNLELIFSRFSISSRSSVLLNEGAETSIVKILNLFCTKMLYNSVECNSK